MQRPPVNIKEQRTKTPPKSLEEKEAEEQRGPQKGPLTYISQKKNNGGGGGGGNGAPKGRFKFPVGTTPAIVAVIVMLMIGFTLFAPRGDIRILDSITQDLETEITTLDEGLTSEADRIDTIISEYARTTDLPNLDPYALEIDIPDLAPFENHLSDVEGDVVVLQAQINALKVKFGATNTTFEDLETQVEVLEAQLDALEARIDTIEEELFPEEE